MSEYKTERPVTIAFDGLHRVGKGTQTRALVETLTDKGLVSIVVRGDGTRDGQGLTQGDPFDLVWQQRNKYIKFEQGGSVENWNASSLVLLRELSELLRVQRERKYDAIIIDRSILSRAAFLLHRGVGMIGERMSLDELYPSNQSLQVDERLDLEALVPDLIFDLQSKNPSTLLKRLDQNDPKYVFRSRNIKGGFESSVQAKSHVPENVEERVEVLDAGDLPVNIHRKVIASLGASALAKRLRL